MFAVVLMNHDKLGLELGRSRNADTTQEALTADWEQSEHVIWPSLAHLRPSSRLRDAASSAVIRQCSMNWFLALQVNQEWHFLSRRRSLRKDIAGFAQASTSCLERTLKASFEE